MADLNRLVIEQPALHQRDFFADGFEWIDCMNADDSILAYLRKAEDPADQLIVVSNFTPVVRQGYRLGVPQPGFYRELLNSDSQLYGGSNVGNIAGAVAEPIGHHGRPASMQLTLPPLATIVLKPE